MVLPRPLRLGAVVVVAAAIGLSACGDDSDTVSQPTTPSTTTAATPTTAGAGATTLLGGASTTTPAGKIVDYVFRDGKVQSGEGRVTVKLGEPITIRVVSDVAEEIHVHTYDKKLELEPGAPGELTFTADIPGVHEVELEDAGLHLFSLEVQ